MGTSYYVGSVTLKAEAVKQVLAEIERLEVPFEVEQLGGGEPHLLQTQGDMAYSTEAVDELLHVIAKADLIEPAVQFVAWEGEWPPTGHHVLVAKRGVVNSADDGVREIEVNEEVPAGEIVVAARAYCDGQGKALILGGGGEGAPGHGAVVWWKTDQDVPEMIVGRRPPRGTVTRQAP